MSLFREYNYIKYATNIPRTEGRKEGGRREGGMAGRDAGKPNKEAGSQEGMQRMWRNWKRGSEGKGKVKKKT